MRIQRMLVLEQLQKGEITISEASELLMKIDELNEAKYDHLNDKTITMAHGKTNESVIKLAMPAKHVLNLKHELMALGFTLVNVSLDQVIEQIIAGKTGKLIDVEVDENYLIVQVV